MNKDREFRAFGVELRLDDSGAAPKLVGHAAVFEQLSEDMGGWQEKIRAGAFRKALKRSDVRALWNHNTDLVLGRQSAKTLKLEEDDTGLRFEIDPPAETQWFQDRMVSLRRGDVREASFGFIVEKDEWENVGKDARLRTIVEMREVFEISPGVTFPAYPQTDVALRSMRAWEQHQEQAEKDALQRRADVVQTELRKRRTHLRGMALK